MIKAGILDAGGVLHLHDHQAILEDIRKTLRVTQENFDHAWGEWVGAFGRGEIDEKEFWRRFLNSTKSRIRLPKVSLFLREYIRKFKLNHEVSEIVETLKNQGLRLAVLSNTNQPHTEFNEGKGVYDQFEVWVLSHEVGLSKPDPEIYILTLN